MGDETLGYGRFGGRLVGKAGRLLGVTIRLLPFEDIVSDPRAMSDGLVRPQMSAPNYSQCLILARLVIMYHVLSVSVEGALTVTPSANSSASDFDFLFGERFKIRNRKLNSRLTGCDTWTEFDAAGEAFPILNGLGNFDRFYAELVGKKFEGLTVRLFDPVTRLWSIYWADSDTGTLDVPTVGSFDGDLGRFYTRDTHAGKSVICQFLWDKSSPDRPVWSQAFSADEGETWEWNWYMHYER